MATDASEAKLEQISVDAIDRNPENPRLIFRSGEMADLLESIRIHGIQVPISVYKAGRRFVLIDGERRLRCSININRLTITELVQQKPNSLGNLLLMFNIHALREQWDLLTIAMKLPRVIELLEKKFGRRPTEREIAEQSGLNRSIIRRSKLLMDLPQEYREQILDELNKPKAQQKITEDLFIEMERSLTTLQRAMPAVIADSGHRDKARKVLLKKFKRGVITNRVHFRMLAKMARVEKVNYDPDKMEAHLEKLLSENDYSIEQAYEETVASAYKERDIGTRISNLIEALDGLDADEIDDDVKEKLAELAKQIEKLIS